MAVDGEDTLYCGGAAIEEVRCCTPQLPKRRGIEPLNRFFRVTERVRPTVCVVWAVMAVGAPGAHKDFAPCLGLPTQATGIKQGGRNDRPQAGQVSRDSVDDRFAGISELYMGETCANGIPHGCPNAGYHVGWRNMGEEERFGVFGVSDTIVGKIPIEAVDSGSCRVTGVAALPVSGAVRSVVEMPLTGLFDRFTALRIKADSRKMACGDVKGVEMVGKISGDE